MRFLAYGWNASIHVTDANDLGQLESALRPSAETNDRPTLIIVDSHIGYGRCKQGYQAGRRRTKKVKLAKRAYS